MMYKISLAALLTIFSMGICAPYTPSAYADDQTDQTDETPRGRLSDGRAFRTDQEGNQLVDYIAELEVNLDTAQRQVVALQDQIGDKQRRIDRLEVGKPADSVVNEKDLSVGSSPVKQSITTTGFSAENLKEACAPIVEKAVAQRVEQANSQTRECQDSVARIAESAKLSAANQKGESNKVESLERELMAREAMLQQLQSDTSKESTIASLQSEILEKNRKLGEQQDQLAMLRESSEKSSRSDAASVNELESVRKELAARDALLSTQQNEIATLKSQTTSLRSVRQESTSPAITTSTVISQPAVSTSSATTLNASRDRAFDTMRGRNTTELTKLRNLIASRDQLYASYKSKPHPVQFSPSAAQTQNGETLSSIETKLANARSMREFSNITRDIQEIQAKIGDDIGLMKRMS